MNDTVRHAVIGWLDQPRPDRDPMRSQHGTGRPVRPVQRLDHVLARQSAIRAARREAAAR